MPVIRKTYNVIFYPLAAVLVVITLIILLQPTGASFRMFTNNAVNVLLGLLGFGMLCMLLAWHRLMFVAFTCVAILCLFLKSSSNPAPIYAEPRKHEDISMLHFNTSSYEGADYHELMDSIIGSDLDLVSIQEITPEWDTLLKASLVDSFPYFSSIPSISFNGLAVFSKMPISKLDTFYYKSIPNLTGVVQSDKTNGSSIRFISTYTNPIFKSNYSYKSLNEHFQTIIDRIGNCSKPKLAFGNYNTVAWSSEIMNFTNRLGLQNSRRSLNPFAQNTYEHIFHTEDIECVDFSNFYDAEGKQVGIKAKLHLKDNIVSQNSMPTIHER